MANCIRCGRQLQGLSFGRKICQWCVQHEAAQRGEIAEDAPQPVIRRPWVRAGGSAITLTQIIFGINAAVFLGMAGATRSLLDFPGDVSVHWGANYGPYTLSGEWWRLVTYMFLHGGVMHIAFNMWCLWDLGALCESLYGRWTFAAIYLTTGIGAGLASLAWNQHVLTVGASGAIFGLAGALIAAFKLGEFSVPRSALSGVMRSLLVFVGFNLIFGAAFPGIDNAAHVGGLVTGLIVGALIAVIAPQQDHSPRRIALFAALALALTGSAMGLARHYRFPLRLGSFADSPENNPANVVAQLQRLVREKPKFVPAHIALAKAYLHRGQFDPAETELKKALELDSKSAEARLELGMLYLNQNRVEDAKNAFSQVLAQDANDAEAHFGLALALAAEGNDPAAVEEYKTAARIDPQAGGINYNLGVSYARLKKYDEAIAAFQKEQQLGGDNAELETALADACQATGEAQQAEEARKKAAQMKDPGRDQ
jgi:rhomboid protease GluP